MYSWGNSYLPAVRQVTHDEFKYVKIRAPFK